MKTLPDHFDFKHKLNLFDITYHAEYVPDKEKYIITFENPLEGDKTSSTEYYKHDVKRYVNEGSWIMEGESHE